MLVQFARFCGVGIIATALQYLILIVLIEAAQVDAVAASAIGFVASATANYLLNYYVTFASERSHRVAGPRFAAVAFAGLTLNTVAMHVGVAVLHLHYLATQVVASVLVLLWNFLANRRWTY